VSGWKLIILTFSNWNTPEYGYSET